MRSDFILSILNFRFSIAKKNKLYCSSDFPTATASGGESLFTESIIMLTRSLELAVVPIIIIINDLVKGSPSIFGNFYILVNIYGVSVIKSLCIMYGGLNYYMLHLIFCNIL